MAEYIEREAALRPFIIDKNGNRIHEVDIDNWQVEIPIKQVKQILREVPAADVVEVVRCGKCKWSVPCREGLGCVNPTGGLTQNLLGKDDFCSGGERRSE